jgi:hypothetical protein
VGFLGLTESLQAGPVGLIVFYASMIIELTGVVKQQTLPFRIWRAGVPVRIQGRPCRTYRQLTKIIYFRISRSMDLSAARCGASKLLT